MTLAVPAGAAAAAMPILPESGYALRSGGIMVEKHKYSSGALPVAMTWCARPPAGRAT